MKKILAMAIGMAAVACIASAESATYSKNAVGFIQKDGTADKLYALTVPFENMDSDDGSWTFSEIPLAQNAEEGAMVYFWTETGWTPDEKDRDGEWGWCGDRKLKAGEFFFFKPSEDMPLVLSGEVPDEVNSVQYVGYGNMNAIGFRYPTEVTFAETEIAQNAEEGTMVYFWTETGWTPDEKDRDGNWGWCGDKKLQPGEGFFFKPEDSSGSGDWEPVKPDVWP